MSQGRREPADARLYMRCSLRGAARNRWTRARGRDELGTDRNQRILPPTPLVSILANHPLSHRKLNGYFFPTATSRVGRDVWSYVPPCSKRTGITRCGTGAAVI